MTRLRRAVALVVPSVTVVLLSASMALAAPPAGGGSVPSPTPNAGEVPGGQQLLNLLGGASFVALAACVAGLLISAARHQIAVHQRQPDKAAHTLHGVQVAGMGACAAGGVHAITAFFFNAGLGIH